MHCDRDPVSCVNDRGILLIVPGALPVDPVRGVLENFAEFLVRVYIHRPEQRARVVIDVDRSSVAFLSVLFVPFQPLAHIVDGVFPVRAFRVAEIIHRLDSPFFPVNVIEADAVRNVFVFASFCSGKERQPRRKYTAADPYNVFSCPGCCSVDPLCYLEVFVQDHNAVVPVKVRAVDGKSPGISFQTAGLQRHPSVKTFGQLLLRLVDADVAHYLHQGLAVFSGKPVEQLPRFRILRLVLSHAGIEGIDKGVVTLPDRLRRRSDAVHRHKPQIRPLVHIPGVVVDGIAQGITCVGIAGNAVHQLTHLARAELAGRVHHGRPLHKKLFHKGLGAGVHFPLECDDLRVLPAGFLPVPDLSGVDVLQLGRCQRLHRILGIAQKHKGIQTDGLQLQILETRVRRRVGTGLVGNDQVRFFVHKADIGIVGLCEAHGIFSSCLVFSRAKAVQHPGKGQRGGGAVRHRKIRSLDLRRFDHLLLCLFRQILFRGGSSGSRFCSRFCSFRPGGSRSRFCRCCSGGFRRCSVSLSLLSAGAEDHGYGQHGA